jgi:hypothetical protein
MNYDNQSFRDVDKTRLQILLPTSEVQQPQLLADIIVAFQPIGEQLAVRGEAHPSRDASPLRGE